MMEYFAKENAQKLAGLLEGKIDQWMSNAGTNYASLYMSLVQAQWRNSQAYYSPLTNPDSQNSALGFIGQQGELAKMTVPVSRTLIRQFVTLITKQRWNFEVLADVTDANPLQTAKLGKALCNYLVDKNQLDLLMEQVAERVCVLGNCFLSCVWKSDKGYIYSRNDDDSLNYSGDVHIEMHDMWDVIFDYSINNFNDLDWIILRRKVNRWDLVAQYPAMADQIKRLPSAYTDTLKGYACNYLSNNDDVVYVREFYHRPTPALPMGRFTAYGDPNCVFCDEEHNNPYQGIPIFSFKFETIQNSCLGYPLLSSLLACQEALDSSYSTITTNQAAFGVQSVLIPHGANIGVSEISGGSKVIYYNVQNAEGGGKPEALQLTATPTEVFNYTKDLSNMLGQLSMVNDTLRGSPPPNVTSGTMAATISANALEFLSTAAKSITIGLEKCMNQVLYNYKTFANVEQIIDVAGEDGISFTKEFLGTDLSVLKKIKIRTQSPIMNSTAGRLQLTDAIMPLLQSGNTEAIDKYVSIIEGGPVETMFESEFSERVAVQQEVDALLDGKTVVPIVTDNHPLFIREYRKLLYNQNIRINSPLLATIMQLMQERIQMEQTMDPYLKAMLRGQPLPPPPPPPGMAPPPGGGMPPPPGPGDGGGQQPVAPPGATPSQAIDAGPVNPIAAPSMPATPQGG